MLRKTHEGLVQRQITERMQTEIDSTWQNLYLKPSDHEVVVALAM